MLERLRLAVQNLDDDAGPEIAGKGKLEAEQLVEDRPGRKHVRARVDGPAFHLFGRHVVQRAHHHAGLRHARPTEARDAEVENLQNPVVADDDVAGLDVAVHDARAMRVMEAGAEVLHDLKLPRQRRRLVALEERAERFALDVLHRDVRLAFVLADIVDGDDVDVLEPAGRSGLARESLAQLGVVKALAQHLDRHFPLDIRIAGEVKLPDPAFTDGAEDLVAAEDFRQSF